MSRRRSRAVLLIWVLCSTDVAAQDLEQRKASTFAHQLLFEADAVLPSEEGAEDGWVENGPWLIGSGKPPSLWVEQGRLMFDTTGLGDGGGNPFVLEQPDGNSAWFNEIDSTLSYTFEVRLKAFESAPAGVPVPGVTIWIANGADRALVLVRRHEILWNIDDPFEILHKGDNATEFVTLRIAYDGIGRKYFVWRDGEQIGRELRAPAPDSRTAIFLIDFGALNEAAGEFDYVSWDSTGAFAPPAGCTPGEATEATCDDGIDNDCDGDIDDADCDCGACGVGPFVRGDCNGDGEVSGSVTDGVFVLRFNFAGGEQPPCLAACDANGDGSVSGSVTDGVFVLRFNFAGGEVPDPPFPECGMSTVSSDALLGCASTAGCHEKE